MRALVPARRPPTDVHLVDFLAGLLAVLALKERARFPIEAGAFDTALYETVRLIEPLAERVRVRPRFRLAPDALLRPNSNLSHALARLAGQGVLRKRDGRWETALSPVEAYVELEALPYPLAYAERAAKVFLKRHAVARVRRVRRGMG